MLETSDELKQLYSTDGNAKEIYISVRGTGTILTNSDIQSEEFTLTEILSSEQQINYGLCNSSKVEFSCINDEIIAENSILDITLKIAGSEEILKLGTYIVDSAKKQTNKNIKKVTAYDRLYSIDDVDMTAFYNTLVFPMTLKQLRDSFFSFCGISCASVSLLNDNLTINTDNDFRDISGREFLQAICELNAAFGKMGRDDEFNFIDLSVPSEYSITEYPVRTVEAENFETKRITRIKVIDSSGTVLYNYGSENEANYYNIKDNFLLTGRTSADPVLQNTINSLYEKMNTLYYTPCRITAKALPFLETGDLLSITKDNQTIHTFIFSRILKGIVGMTDSYEANGVNTIREAYSAETVLNQNIYKSNQTNRINYITESNGEPIILPTTGTVAVNKRFSCTATTSDFEYMAVVTAQVEEAGEIEFHYKLDDTTLLNIAKQSAQSGTYQQIVLYMPFQAYDIGSHKLEIEVISDATGKIDINHWISCLKGQNISETGNAVVSITIIDLPEKLRYSVNETLDLKGLKVAANYKSGDRKILDSNEYSVSADTSEIGQKNAVVSYNENAEIKDFFKIIVENSFIAAWQITAGEFTFPDLEYTSRKGTIDWGDDSEIEEYDSSLSYNHNYNSAGTYTIKIDCPVELIKNQAFLNRTDLVEITCTTAKTFEQQCFRGCTALKTAMFSAETKEIPNLMFHNCKKLENFNLDGVERIGYNAFLSSGISGSLTIPRSVNFIDSNAFRQCAGISSVISENKNIVFNNDTVNMNYSYQFYDDYNITEFDLSAETIPERFAYISNVTNLKTETLKFREGVKILGKSGGQPCFCLGAANVTDCSVYIPSTTTTIGTLCKIPTGQTGHYHILHVYYNGTLADWNKIAIHSTKGFWSDGTPYVTGYLHTNDGNQYLFNTHGTGVE